METANRKLKATGLILIAIGIVLMLCTAAGMISAFNRVAFGEGPASAFAWEVQRTMDVMRFGGPALIAGGILWIVGWWRGKQGQRAIH